MRQFSLFICDIDTREGSTHQDAQTIGPFLFSDRVDAHEALFDYVKDRVLANLVSPFLEQLPRFRMDWRLVVESEPSVNDRHTLAVRLLAMATQAQQMKIIEWYFETQQRAGWQAFYVIQEHVIFERRAV